MVVEANFVLVFPFRKDMGIFIGKGCLIFMAKSKLFN